ncbi:MAG: hypothetical protein COA86_01545 [Kangiella sp.]|nr:MAG: hypothetical protein COA86_01545 [Kangiella sp.]
MDKKKEHIKEDDIETKELPRRKFMLNATGTVVATGIALTGVACGSSTPSDASNADTGNNADPRFRDADVVALGGDLTQTTTDVNDAD